jgi:uncharacterized protein (DUF433 family)
MTRIYLAQNEQNGKVYVGKTIHSVEDRWYQHRKKASNQSRLLFHRAIRKYGESSFSVYEIDAVPDSEGPGAEQFYISLFRSCDTDFGYNLTIGGEGAPKISSDSDEEIVKRYRRGETVASLADYFDVGEETIRKAIRRHSATKPYGHAQKIGLPAKEVVSRYLAGETQSSIAESFSVSRIVVLHTLVEAGVQIRARTPSGKPAWNNKISRIPEELVVSTYLSGLTLEETAKFAGVTGEAVRQLLARLGVPRRPAIARNPRFHPRRNKSNSDAPAKGIATN